MSRLSRVPGLRRPRLLDPWRRPLLPRLPWHVILAASLAGAATIATLSVGQDLTSVPLLVGAFGSSCVLVFLVPHGPHSHPANVLVGHVAAAACGIAVSSVLPLAWYSLAAGMGLAMAVMAGLRVIHAPAGATALAVMLVEAGWDYLLAPILSGALVLTACALLYRRLMWRVIGPPPLPA